MDIDIDVTILYSCIICSHHRTDENEKKTDREMSKLNKDSI